MRRGVFASATFVVGVGLLAWALRTWSPGLPLIGPADLESAQRRWAAAGPADYDLTVVLGGRQTGELKVSVRDGEATGLARNGVPLAQPRTWEPWTVPGMFETLTTDFENRDAARRKFGVEPSSIHLRCEFDARYGYPKRYLHQIYGRHQDLEWTVTEFVER